MTSTPDQIREDIERTRGGLSEDVNQLADAVDPRQVVARQGEKVKDAVAGLKDKVMGSETADSMHAVAGAPARASGWAASTTRSNPWGAGLVALGVGWLVGSLLPATDRERSAMHRIKDTAGPALSATAGDTAGAVAEHLREPVADAAAAVKASASKAAATVSDTASEHGVSLPEAPGTSPTA